MQIVPTGLALGAEVRGIDIRRPLSPEDAATLRAAWHQHLVLFVRRQPMTVEQHMAFTRHFGELEFSGPNYFRKYYGGAKEDRAGAEMPPEISVISNIVVDGKPIGSLGYGEAKWHTDSSIGEMPPAGGFLRAIEIPEDGSGATSFLNMEAAWETLAPELRQAVAGRRLQHPASNRITTRRRPGFEQDVAFKPLPVVDHPLVRTHPETGRPSLYLGQQPNTVIVGMDPAESKALIEALWAHTVQDRFVYRHDWQVGDLVIWDNRNTMHRRDAFPAASRRLLHKTQTAGTRPT